MCILLNIIQKRSYKGNSCFKSIKVWEKNYQEVDLWFCFDLVTFDVHTYVIYVKNNILHFFKLFLSPQTYRSYHLNQKQNHILNIKEHFGRSKTNCLKLKIYSKSGHSARGRDVCCLADDHYKRKKKIRSAITTPFLPVLTYLKKDKE